MTSVIESYMPLYRKYRPQQLSDLVGQDTVVTALGNAMKMNKIAHAYLFCGPRGTGKTSTARIIAKSLNCDQGPTITPCQTCASCLAVTRGNALDVTEIDAASHNSVDDVRDMTEKVHFSPIEGKYKIYIIDEVHMLSAQAFNALLKTLEEPPPNVIFIFATTEPHKVLPTILSRCQRYDMSRIHRQQIEERIKFVAEQEGIRITEDAVTMIARHVRGGMRDALGLLDQVAVLGLEEGGHEITRDDVRSFIGDLEEQLLFDLAGSIGKQDAKLLLDQIHEMERRGIEPAQVLKSLTGHYRNLLMAKTCGPQVSGDQFDLPQDTYDQLCEQAQLYDAEVIPQVLYQLSLMQNQLRHSTASQMWLEVGLLALCFRESIHQVKDLEARIQKLEAALQGGQPIQTQAPAPRQQAQTQQDSPPPPPPTRASQPPPAREGVTPPQVSTEAVQAEPMTPLPQAQPAPQAPAAEAAPEGMWDRILGGISHVPTQALVRQYGTLRSVEEDRVIISFNSQTLYDMFFKTPDKPQHLSQAVKEVVGRPVNVEVVVNRDPKPQLAARKVASQPSRPVPPASPPEPEPKAPAQHAPELFAQQSPAHPIDQEPPPPDEEPEDPGQELPPTQAEAQPPLKQEDQDLAQAKLFTRQLLSGKPIN